ncbi:MAG TPA: ATP-binding protein [Fontimonas sp.]
MTPKSRHQIRTEELERRLTEAEETLEAIRNGDVDALIVSNGHGPKIYTLEGVDRPYRMLIEQMQQGAATLSPDGVIAYCNPRLAELLGIPGLHLGGSRLEQHVAAADRPWLAALLRDGQRGTAQGETHLERTDGVPVPVYLTVSALESGAGAPLCVLVTDLTDAKFEDLYEHAPDMMCSVDAGNGLILQCNETLSRVLGYPKREILGRPELDFYAPDCRVRALENFRQFQRSGQVLDDELKLLGKDGRTLHVSLSASAIRDSSGRIVRSRSVLRDISDRKRAEDALRDADRRKDEFLAILAHELRNPLAPIRNAVEVLRRRPGNDPQIAWTGEIIDRQLNQLTRLVDDLLDVSRITRNKIDLRRERVEVSSVVNRAVEACQPLIESRQHRLEIDLPATPIWLYADTARITQVLGNLINNAAKYTPSGGSIGITAAVDGGKVRIAVRDDGIGIAADLQAQVFDMFVQAETARDRSQGGLGIGLTLVKNLVEMHGGTARVKSGGLGSGSEFIVELPEAPATPETQLSSADPSQPVMRPLRVLVVDDNKDAADTLSILLGLWGHTVSTANSGVEAIRLAARANPEVILMDLGMPIMNGYEAAEQILQRPDNGPVTLIALTGWGQEADRHRTQAAGFHHHLTKPVSIEQLQSLFATL